MGVKFKHTSAVTWKNRTSVHWQKFEAGVGGAFGHLDDLEIESFDNIANVTLDDNNDLANSGILYVGVGGDVKVIDIAGNTLVITGVPNGRFIYTRVKRVFDSGTSASEIIVCF